MHWIGSGSKQHKKRRGKLVLMGPSDADLEVSAPQGGGGELSDYEKLRVARMEVNTEFLRGLGLA